MAWFDKLRAGLDKTRDVLTTDVRELGKSWEMDWDDLEFALIAADTGANIASDVVAETKKQRELGISFQEALEQALLDQLEPDRMRQKLRRVGFDLDVTRNMVDVSGKVIMMVGVNGVGKTTTIAKLGQYY
ncbi:MAG: signal recognition particle-docking protein FtsY, partial [Deinococcota bacterium]